MSFFDGLQRHFIPREDNDYKPHILQEAAVVGMLGLVLLTFTVANLQSLLWVASDWMVSTILPAVIISETNDERAADNLVPLVHNRTLDAAAQLKADNMAKEGYFAHYSPEGVSPWYWFDQAGYNYVHAGENLAVHFTDSSEVVEAWMNSPTHRANIMNGNYQEIGIGTARGTYEGFDTVFVVQLFGTPAAAAAPSVVAQAEPAVVIEPESDLESVATVASSSGPLVAGLQEEVVRAEPESVVVTEEVPSTDSGIEPVPSEEVQDKAVEQVPPTHTPVNEGVLTFTDEGTTVYESYISTTTGGVPATVSTHKTDNNTPPAFAFATQPHRVLQFVYILLGSFVFIALLLSIFIEIRRQQPLQVVYGAGLVATMLLLFYVHLSVTSGAVIL